jgi:NTE family protein
VRGVRAFGLESFVIPAKAGICASILISKSTDPDLRRGDNAIDLSKMESTKKKVGLALGGGGARGVAHVGIIKELIRAGISIDYIAGTSMGSMVGGLYAMTKDIELVEDIFLKLRSRDIFPLEEFLKHKAPALFHGESMAKLIGANFKDAAMEDCKIPFRAVATDMNNGETVVLKTGMIADAVRASSAIPVIFPPVRLHDKLLADGGFSDPVPVNVAKEMGAEFVIAVDVSSRWNNPTSDESIGIKAVYSIFSSALSIVEYQLSKEALKGADIVLRPPVFQFDWLEFGKSEEIIDIGAEEMRLHLKEAREKLGIVQPPKHLGEKFLDFLFPRE